MSATMGRMAIATLAALVALALVVPTALDRESRRHGPSGEVAVSDTRGGKIVILAADDGRIVTRVGVRATQVDMSSDGRLLAFDSLRGLVVRPVDSVRTSTVAPCSSRLCPVWPSWNGTGSSLAYTLGDFIYTVHADGVGRARITRGQAPSWSAHTSEIAFMRDYSGRAKAGKVYVSDLAGSNVRFVTRGSYPSFDPSGTRIAFTLGAAVYSVSADGGTSRRVIRNGAWPAWSPDGRYIAFTRQTSCRPTGCFGRVFLVPATGGAKPEPIGPEIAGIGPISWSR
jgi:Tol biopolymer transport system component